MHSGSHKLWQELRRNAYWNLDSGAQMNMKDMCDDVVGGCHHCNFMARNKRMNIKKSYRLLHQTLTSSCGNFWYVDALHSGKDSEIILGASCAKCKLLKIKILDQLKMQDMVDFLVYELSLIHI